MGFKTESGFPKNKNIQFSLICNYFIVQIYNWLLFECLTTSRVKQIRGALHKAIKQMLSYPKAHLSYLTGIHKIVLTLRKQIQASFCALFKKDNFDNLTICIIGLLPCYLALHVFRKYGVSDWKCFWILLIHPLFG